jgi:hypothetical protein
MKLQMRATEHHNIPIQYLFNGVSYLVGWFVSDLVN